MKAKVKNKNKIHYEQMFFKKSISKGLLKIKSNLDLSKVHNYRLVKVLKENIFHLILLFHFSMHIWSPLTIWSGI
jgi:hypothetical protein